MVEVLKCGLYDSIQDLGRFGVQEYGVPFSGAMDLNSAKVANSLLGNPIACAVLEMTIIGPKLKFHCATEIVLSGADLNPILNNKPVKMNTRIQINENDILSFGRRHYGCRVYMAVTGGFQAEFIMNSYSMYEHITSQSRLKIKDQLHILKHDKSIEEAHASLKIDKAQFQTEEVEVFKGPEYDCLSIKEKNLLFSTEFTISKDSNRMAYQVNEYFKNNLESIITSLVLPGTVQLTPSGRLLFLMRDCQVTGGYPRILQVSESSINHLAQKTSGDKFRLKCID